MDYIAEQLRPLAVPIDSVHPDAANARKHGEKNMAAIVASLSRFGQRAPIVVQRKGMVVRAGNGRLAAAKSLGWSHIAAVVVDDESVEAVAFAIADNRTAELAEWDKETLASLLDTLPEEDLGVTGFDESDLKELLSELAPQVEQDAEPKTDRAEELRVKWGVERGQVWTLGDHRLMCGDSTGAEDVGRLLGGCVPLLMVTDPPYGVDYEGGQANDKKREKLEGDESGDLFGAALSIAAKIMPRGAWYVWHAGTVAEPCYAAVREAGYEARALIVWHKLSAHYGAPSAHYCQKHEPCLYAVRGTANWCGPSNEVTVWDLKQPSKNEYHPTQKPVELFARAIANHDSEYVYEPFSGSGTTIIACEQLKRKCRAMEISPGYVAVALQRWADATGGTPTRV